MNRAAFAARLFLVITLLPVIVAAGWSVYDYRTQPPIPLGTYRPFPKDPLVKDVLGQRGFLLGVYAPTPGPAAAPATGGGKGKARKASRTAPPAATTGLADFDAAIGCPAVSITLRYVKWGELFPQAYVASAAGRGSETMIELMPKERPSLAQIADGSQDRWLRSFARQILGLGDHVILSFAPEMNGTWYNYGHGHKGATPARYRAAFVHVHDVIGKIAGPLVTWMWQPSAMHTRVVPGPAGTTVTKGTPSPKPYWPGARYVGEIGLDGYYYYRDDTFDVIFGPTIKMLRKLAPRTPIMIGEVAAGPEFNKPSLDRQVADIKDLFAGISKYGLGGLIWFDRNQLTKHYRAGLRQFHQDWRLQDNQAALAAFRREISQAGPLASPRGRRPVSC